MQLTQVFILIVACSLRTTAWHDAPFENASLVPGDIHFYVHVDDAASLRKRVAGRPLGDSIRATFERSALDDAWERLADAADVETDELFDHLLGRKLTLALRRDHDDRYEWAALTSVTDDAWQALNARLRPRLCRPAYGLTIRRLPEHELLLTRKGERVLIGPDPSDAPSLFYDLLPMLAGEGGKTLAASEGLVEASKLGDGDVGVFLRQPDPLGGWSAVVLELDDEVLRVRHASRFRNSPFGKPYRRVEFNKSLLDELQATQTLVLAQPMRTPTGPLATFVRAQMPPDAVSEAMQRNFGQRVVIMVDEPGGGEEARIAIAVAIEVQNETRALADLDAFMSGLLAAFSDTMAPSDRPNIAKVARLGPDETRVIGVSAAARALFPKLPIPDRSTLCWTTSSGGRGAWWLIGSDRQQLESLEQIFGGPMHLPPATVMVAGHDGYAEGGSASGQIDRIGELLVDAAKRQGEDHRAVQSVVRFVADLADDFTACRWRLQVPSEHAVESVWQFEMRSPRQRNYAPEREPVRTADR